MATFVLSMQEMEFMLRLAIERLEEEMKETKQEVNDQTLLNHWRDALLALKSGDQIVVETEFGRLFNSILILNV